MKIAIGCDHGGLEHKNAIVQHLIERGFEVEDFGIHELAAVDYPDIAVKVTAAITSGDCKLGILICGTGVGISIAANKVRGVRAAVCLMKILIFCSTLYKVPISPLRRLKRSRE